MLPSGFQILYEDGPCLVVAKPGGLLTQAVPGIDSLEVRLKEFLKIRDGKIGKVYLGVPHRLDRPVSGALVFARNIRATKRICEQFEGRMVQKIYWAFVEGTVAGESGTWIDHVRKVPEQPMAEIVPRTDLGARLAVLHYRVKQRTDTGTWLEIELETGRMHQIRIQASSRGHAVIGDSQYGASISFGPAVEDIRARWIALHARTLAFRHPMTREPVDVTAPLPEVWSELACDERFASPS